MKEETSMEKKICRKLKRVLNTLSDLRVGLLQKKAGYESSRPSVQAWSGIDGTVVCEGRSHTEARENSSSAEQSRSRRLLSCTRTNRGPERGGFHI